MISTLLRLIPHKTWRQKALDAWGADAPRIAVLRLAGTIGPNAPLRGGLNLAGLAEDIEQAFTMRGVKAVALAINSPGGSPVQSALIYRRIRALADENELPVFVNERLKFYGRPGTTNDHLALKITRTNDD